MSTCILTDTTALFPPAQINQNGHLRKLALKVDGEQIALPSVDGLIHVYQELEREFNTILMLTVSGDILPIAEIAQEAVQSHGGRAKITVLDSRQIGPALGLLAQLGAQLASAGASLAEIEANLRATSHHLYSLIGPDPGYPATMENAEAGTLDIFSCEDGQLSSYKKVRTRRHLLESFDEFIAEFECPQQVVFFHGRTPGLRARPLRETSRQLFPKVPFSEIELSAPLAAYLGHSAVGIVVMEAPKHILVNV